MADDEEVLRDEDFKIIDDDDDDHYRYRYFILNKKYKGRTRREIKEYPWEGTACRSKEPPQ